MTPEELKNLIETHNHDGINTRNVKQSDLTDDYDGSTAVKLTGDQTVAGIKTFSSIPVLPASNPTTDNQATRKAYVDTRFAATEVYATDDLRDSADTEGNSTGTDYSKVKEIKINERGGTIRVKFDMYPANATDFGWGRIYVNGVAVGTEQSNGTGAYVTYSEDITVATNDLVQLYVKKSGTVTNTKYRNFRLYYNKRFTITAGTIISN